MEGYVHFFDMADEQDTNVCHKCWDPKALAIRNLAPRRSRIEILCGDALER